MIYLARVDQVDLIWPHIKDGMERACKKGGGQYTQDWLWTLCRKGDALLVVIIEGDEIKGGVVCEVQNWTGKQVLYVHALCGRGYLEWVEALHEYGCSQFGVKSIMFEGRPGHGGVVPGVKVVRHVYEIEVTP